MKSNNFLFTNSILIFIVFMCLRECIESGSPFKVKWESLPSTVVSSDRIALDNTRSLTAEYENPFEIIYQWRRIDFEYRNYASRQRAIANGDFVPENNLPLGIDRYADRLFITLPRWKNGVPASLAWLPLPQRELSPPMQPYPDWESHGDPEAQPPDCTKLMSVYRLAVDADCQRLWVIDAGIVNATIKLNQVCPPKIVIFDLKTNRLIQHYELPDSQVKQDSLHSNIVIDVRNGKCNDAYAYVTDVWRFGIVVFSLAMNRSWRTTNHLFLPNPLASDYTLHGLNFQWTDGAFGLSLSDLNAFNDRILYFHPLSSFQEFMVTTSVLRNENLWLSAFGGAAPAAFIPIGDRGSRGQSSTSGIDRNGVQFFTLVQQDAIGCWDTEKPYKANNLGLVAENQTTLYFPNDLKVDHERDQGVWVLSNRLPAYLYASLDYTDVNFRIMRASVDKAIRNGICDPKVIETQTDDDKINSLNANCSY